MIDHAAFMAQSDYLEKQLEERSDESTRKMLDAAEADALLKKEKAKAFLRATGTVGQREAQRDIETAELYKRYVIADALARSARDALLNTRYRLDLLRTRWSSAKAERI